jgi:hypothetical protein
LEFWVVGGVDGDDVMDVLGLLFLTDVEFFGCGLTLGESVASRIISTCSYCVYIESEALTYPPAEPVALEAAEPVAPSVKRRAEAEK